MKKLAVTLSVVFFSLLTFAGDVLTLTNEMVFEGKVARIKDCSIVFIADGERYTIPADDIYSIQFENVNDKVYMDYIALTQDDPNKCLNGSLDAENYHGKKGGAFFLGVLFGPFAIIGTALSEPSPLRGKNTAAMSKNKDLFNDPEYLSCYKKKAKGQLIGAEALGWASWVLLLLMI